MHKKHLSYVCVIVLWFCSPTRATASSFLSFLDYTQRRNTVRRTPLDGWSARRRDLCAWQRTTLRTDKHPYLRRFWTHNISRQATAEPRHRPRGHWDRQTTCYYFDIWYSVSGVEEEKDLLWSRPVSTGKQSSQFRNSVLTSYSSIPRLFSEWFTWKVATLCPLETSIPTHHPTRHNTPEYLKLQPVSTIWCYLFEYYNNRATFYKTPTSFWQ